MRSPVKFIPRSACIHRPHKSRGPAPLSVSLSLSLSPSFFLSHPENIPQRFPFASLPPLPPLIRFLLPVTLPLRVILKLHSTRITGRLPQNQFPSVRCCLPQSESRRRTRPTRPTSLVLLRLPLSLSHGSFRLSFGTTAACGSRVMKCQTVLRSRLH